MSLHRVVLKKASWSRGIYQFVYVIYMLRGYYRKLIVCVYNNKNTAIFLYRFFICLFDTNVFHIKFRLTV